MTQTNNETHRLLRVRQIIKPDGMLPICRSSFYHMVAKGLISPGIRLGPRTRVWKETEIKGLIKRLEAEGARHG